MKFTPPQISKSEMNDLRRRLFGYVSIRKVCVLAHDNQITLARELPNL